MAIFAILYSGDPRMSNADTLATVASVIAGFGAAMLSFRLGREVTAQEEGEYSWIPWADALLIAAIFVSLLLVVFPIVTFRTLSGFAAKLPVAACSVLFAGGRLCSGDLGTLQIASWAEASRREKNS